MARDIKMVRVWRSMKNRCLNSNQKAYKDYGGRGIKVCDRWLGKDGFNNFMLDMGYPPAGYSIERVDVNGHYEPENCKWIPLKDQASNKRNSRYIVANGKTQTMAQWARELGCNPAAILYRLQSGMSEEEAINTPLDRNHHRKLTDEQVVYVKTSYPNKTAQALANEVGVSKKTILNILHGKIYTHIQE